MNALRSAYQARRDALDTLLTLASDPATTDGATVATNNDLVVEIARIRGLYNANSSQSDIDSYINDLQAKLDALRADKTILNASINSYNSQPDYIQDDPSV